MRHLLEAWPTDGCNLEASLGLVATESLPLSAVRLHAPVDRCSTILAIGKNYAEHVKEVSSSLPNVASGVVPTHPIVFIKASSSLAAHGDAIVLPLNAQQVDYEGEIGIVIGKLCRHVSAADALAHVFGVVPMNDVSARDLQARHQQWALAKSCDTFCPVGPFILPLRAEGLPALDLGELRVSTHVNGELRQQGVLSQLIFGVPKLLETISAGQTLYPGDVIATGTPAGVGAGFRPQRWLSPGDVVRVGIDGVCFLQNHVSIDL
jgi:2-keto-4-pentenoate hydratase/2-oxohepta-3-ene-1,7-dioic acid hydratase in catechol pathway